MSDPLPAPLPAPLIVTRNAMDRYRDHVADLSDREIFAALSGPTFELAAAIGAPFVKLGTGQRAVIRDSTVVTILHAGSCRGVLDPRRDHPSLSENPQP